MVPILYDCPGNREPITLSKSQTLELKSPTGLLWNQTLFLLSIKGQVKHFFIPLQNVIYILSSQNLSQPTLSLYTANSICYGLLLCSPDEDGYHGLIELKMEREKGWKRGSLFFKWLHFSHRNPIDHTQQKLIPALIKREIHRISKGQTYNHLSSGVDMENFLIQLEFIAIL